jgi:predicted Fe-Mo cluster-binding NifX family protein
MRICIPVRDNQEKESHISDHFGSAPYFVLADTATGDIRVVENRRHDHEHGACKPIDHIDREAVEAVVCRGMGRRALASLNHGGIRVLTTTTRTAGEAIAVAQSGGLHELTLDEACGGHAHHHERGGRHGRHASESRRHANRRVRQGR